MEKWFGSTYEGIGSTSSDLLLKTRGQVKIQIGKRFVDLIKDGKIASSNEPIFYTVESIDDIDKNGIYLIGNDVYIRIEGNTIQVTQPDSDTSETFVSIISDQQTTNQQKKIARKNIGLDYKDVNEALQISEGIVFVGSTIYHVSNGVCTEYKIDKFNELDSRIEEITNLFQSYYTKEEVDDIIRRKDYEISNKLNEINQNFGNINNALAVILDNQNVEISNTLAEILGELNMDTIEQQLIKLTQIKENIRQAINTRGVVLTTDDVFSIYPDAIMRIGIHKITTSFEDITSDAPLIIKDEKSLTINLTPDSGINVGLVTVLMGDNDITSTSYSNGVINISSVTDDVSITAIGIIDFADSTVKSLCVSNWGGNVVPDEITKGEAAAVTSLGGVFRGNTDITTFDELRFFTGLTSFSVTSGNGEFQGCNNLTTIKLPNITVNSIDLAGLFRACSKITSADLSLISTQSITSIQHIFRGNTSITEVSMPSGSYSGSATYAFASCSNLTNLNVGTADWNGITSFGSGSNGTFYNCSKLETITGTITGIKYDVSLANSPKLTRESLLIIINGLAEVTTQKTLTLHATAKDRLTEDDIAIATAKNWTIS